MLIQSIIPYIYSREVAFYLVDSDPPPSQVLNDHQPVSQMFNPTGTVNGFSLPTEILVVVCSHLFRADNWSPGSRRWAIQEFRLVCREFAAAAFQFLTSVAYLSQYDYDLEILTTLSQHPILSKNIRSMVCDDSHLSPAHRSETLDKKAVAHLKRMQKEQKNIRRQGEDLAVFCAALTRFPNLKSITVTDGCNDIGGSYSTPVRFRSGSWDTETLWPLGWPAKVPFDHVWNQASSPYHTFITVIRGLSIMGHQIHELSVESKEYGISHRMMFDASHKDFEHLCNVFKSLLKVDLNINTHGEALWEEGTLKSGLIGAMLSKATCLESLQLSSVPSEANGYINPVLTLSEGLGDTVWPFLHRLSLNEFSIGHRDLTGFLLRHRATLRHVQFLNLFLEGGSWSETLIELRKNSIIWDKCDMWQITDEDIDYCQCGDNIVRYLREGGDNPLADPACRFPNTYPEAT